MTEPLTPREHAVLLALMTPGATIVSAALAAGADESTVRRYYAKPAFKAALREAQSASVAHSTTSIATACDDAVAALKRVLADVEAPPAATVAAARELLRLAREDVVDADLATRLEAVEASMKGASK